MALLPLLKCNVIDANSLVIDAKSGTTGAGKKAVEAQLFSEVEGECLPYKVGTHQHLPEIQLFSQVFGDWAIDPFFSTSLLSTRRGIIAGLYAKLHAGKNAQDVASAFQEFYHNYPLVQVSNTITRDSVSLKKVVGTASTHISFNVVGEKLYVYSCLDNLLKGAASQAVENFNLLHHFPVTTGLDHLEALT
jgi:N-acetyl-gamma-glutamyl-phosphate reductase